MGGGAESRAALVTAVLLVWNAKAGLLLAARANDGVVLADELGVVVGRKVVLQVQAVRAHDVTHDGCRGTIKKVAGGFQFFLTL